MPIKPPTTTGQGVWVCRHCAADNSPDDFRCGFCNYDPRDLATATTPEK